MAILRADNFELEFSYYNLSNANLIEYALVVRFSGQQFFNPAIINQTYNGNAKGFGGLIFCDCLEAADWLMAFFTSIWQTKKGSKISNMEPPTFHFEAVTWEDKRIEIEKRWEGKTVNFGLKDGIVVKRPYSEAADLFFRPLFEDEIEFIIDFPCEYFIGDGFREIRISFKTSFSEMSSFLDEIAEEMSSFYSKYAKHIRYLGEFKYETIHNK